MNTAVNIENPSTRTPVVHNAVFGTLIFIIAEAMFFTGLMTSYIVIRMGAGLRWVPPPDVRLPVVATAFNTAALLISGILMILAVQWFKNYPNKSKWAFIASMLLGTTFVVLQGREWINLISNGMTIHSGVFGATFFMLIGSHALHAVTAIIAMLYVLTWINQGRCKIHHLQAMMLYWLFIVGVWPILYRLVYF